MRFKAKQGWTAVFEGLLLNDGLGRLDAKKIGKTDTMSV
jgi:hypothetical protein